MWRKRLELKPDIWTPKPKLKINDETLIGYQISWLRKHGIGRITLATNDRNLTDDLDVIYSVEEKSSEQEEPLKRP